MHSIKTKTTQEIHDTSFVKLLDYVQELENNLNYSRKVLHGKLSRFDVQLNEVNTIKELCSNIPILSAFPGVPNPD